MRRDPDGHDVVNNDGRIAAANAVRVRREVLRTKLAPLGVVPTVSRRRPVLVGPGLALAFPREALRAALTWQVDAVAEAADTGNASGHRGQATGTTLAPLMTTAPAAIEVPPFFVSTGRM